jgi:UDP-N-acetylglucosamine 4,6-dehydratase
MFDNATILITGGTGSFGRLFTKTLLAQYPKIKKIIIFSRDELKQFEMQQEFNSPVMRYFIGDVRDPKRLEYAMRGVDYVVHAAALKQVPAAEYNPNECILTNINGAQNVIDAALMGNVKKVIALSTDKAANPINLYGATKLASDKLFVAANNMTGGFDTRFAVVRYGNVVGSRGSVVPFFNQLLAQGVTKLPITHPEMTRFWITLAQGIEFTIKSFARMQGGEIFVPKIPSIRLPELAQAMSGQAEIDIVGIRPGEKLHEVMVPEEVSHQTVEFADHFVITPAIKLYDVDARYTHNNLGEEGAYMAAQQAYDSGQNPHFLSVSELCAMEQYTT